MIHSRGLSPSGGENCHLRAAPSASPAKYRLDPGESIDAPLTFPDASTLTRMLVLIFPVIVARALAVTSGITWLTMPGGCGPALVSCSVGRGSGATGFTGAAATWGAVAVGGVAADFCFCASAAASAAA